MFNLGRRLITLMFLSVCLVVIGAVLALPAMAVEQMQIPSPAGNCLKCHDPSIHPVDNCTACHDLAYAEPTSEIPGGHGGLNVSDAGKAISTAPVGNCQVCHMYTAGGWDMCGNCHPSEWGDWIPPAQLVSDPAAPWREGYTHDATRLNGYVGTDNTYNCEMCHVQNWWLDIPQHDSTVFGSAYSHLDTIDTKCTGCHFDSLTTEHAQLGRNDRSGNPVDCFTCHENGSPGVQQSISNQDSSCAACHATLHNNNAAPRPSADILLYPGLKWSSPMVTAIWQGEPWVEDYVYGYRIIISNRSTLAAEDVWIFYRDGLAARGWTPQSPEPAAGTTNFKSVFAKGNNKIVVWFYGSEERLGQGTSPGGSRIEIIYNT